MGLLSSLGLKDGQNDRADAARADTLKAQFGKDLKSVVVLATRLRDQEAKKKVAADLQTADAELRRAGKLSNPAERAQAMQAALDKVSACAARANEARQAEVSQPANGTAAAARAPVEQVCKNKNDRPQARQTTTTSEKDGTMTVQVDTDTASSKPDSVSRTHRTDTHTVESGGAIVDRTESQTDTMDKEGPGIERERVEQVIDATGRRVRKEKQKGKDRADGMSSSDEVEVDSADGSRVVAARSSDSTWAKDGTGILRKESHTQIVDAKGNSVTIDVKKESQVDKDGKVVATGGSMGIHAKTAEQAAADKAALEQAIEAKQAEVAAAKNKAVGRGNRLYTLFHANQLAAAGQKHNAGMAELRSGDADAARVGMSADRAGCEASGDEAIGHYDAAAQLFGEGMAMSGEGVRPPQEVPESGGV